MSVFRHIVISLSFVMLVLGSYGHVHADALPSSPEKNTDAGGDLVNNGGGLAEMTFLLTFERLDTYLKSCLNSTACRLDAKQAQVLSAILTGLPAERLNPNLIQFVSEANNPGFFIIDSEMKVAKTGSKPGSPIYVNTDMLYIVDATGFKVPIGTSEMVVILVHELGHHYGVDSHEFLDLLGVRVGIFLSKQSYETSSLPWLRDVRFHAINASKDDIGFPDVTLTVGDRVIDLSQDFKKAGLCVFQPFPSADVESKWPLGSYLYNLHWAGARQGKTSSDLTMVGYVSHWCQYRPSFEIQRQDHEIMVRVRVNSATGKTKVKRISIRQVDKGVQVPKK